MMMMMIHFELEISQSREILCQPEPGSHGPALTTLRMVSRSASFASD